MLCRLPFWRVCDKKTLAIVKPYKCNLIIMCNLAREGGPRFWVHLSHHITYVYDVFIKECWLLDILDITQVTGLEVFNSFTNKSRCIPEYLNLLLWISLQFPKFLVYIYSLEISEVQEKEQNKTFTTFWPGNLNIFISLDLWKNWFVPSL